MKILQLSRTDLGGVGIKLKKAISEHTEHECRALRGNATYIGYEGDVTSPDGEKWRELIDWADIVHCHEFPMLWKWAQERPVVWHLHGGYFKSHHEEMNKFLDDEGITTVVATPDLLALRPTATWLPPSIEIAPLLSYRAPTGDTFRLVQTTTWEQAKIAPASLNGFAGELDVVYHVPHEEALRRKGRATVVFDQFAGPMGEAYQTGALGISGLEAMAMGIPVLSSGPDELLIVFRKLWGELPFFPTTREELSLHLKTLQESPALLKYWAERGSRFVRKWHDPATVAKKAVAIYEGVLGAE
jgi:glycosyltransferase involved in cell wall biosynthesis